MAGGWGGARRGAGRPRADGSPADGHDPGESTGALADLDRERADHERVKREQREFKLAQEMGEWLPRAEVQQASATALAVLTQSLRSLSDILERSAGLTPQQATSADAIVDNALSEVAAAFRAMAE